MLLTPDPWPVMRRSRHSLPARRVPGSGKSSLIHTFASQLMLDICTLSLSSSSISYCTITTLLPCGTARCIVILKDLDAASALAPLVSSPKASVCCFQNFQGKWSTKKR